MSMPNPSDVVLVCVTCHHWQIDIPPRVLSDLGGAQAALMAAAEAHATEHTCPGDGDRFKMGDQWVDKPLMASGERPTGMLGAFPLPRWWVKK